MYYVNHTSALTTQQTDFQMKNSFLISWICVLLACCCFQLVLCDDVDAVLRQKFQRALAKTKDSIRSLAEEWQIAKYPNFLKSCYMHKSSWETMKFKFMVKALSAAVSKHKESFVVSFTGRYVTSPAIFTAIIVC
jgi:hypothetical protein